MADNPSEHDARRAVQLRNDRDRRNVFEKHHDLLFQSILMPRLFAQRGQVADPRFRHLTKHGRQGKFLTHIFAGLNFVFFALLTIRYVAFAEDDGTFLFRFMTFTGNAAYYLYLITTVFMFGTYAMARCGGEFANSDDLDEPQGVVTQSWVYFSGGIFFFILLFNLIMFVQ